MVQAFSTMVIPQGSHSWVTHSTTHRPSSLVDSLPLRIPKHTPCWKRHKRHQTNQLLLKRTPVTTDSNREQCPPLGKSSHSCRVWGSWEERIMRLQLRMRIWGNRVWTGTWSKMNRWIQLRILSRQLKQLTWWRPLSPVHYLIPKTYSTTWCTIKTKCFHSLSSSKDPTTSWVTSHPSLMSTSNQI